MCGEDGGVAIGEHSEVVAFDVEEGEDQVAPAVFPDEARPAFGAVFVEGIGGIDEVEKDVIKPGLEGGDRGALRDEEGGEGVCRGDAEGEDLAGRKSVLRSGRAGG